jgi:hypothetical protein
LNHLNLLSIINLNHSVTLLHVSSKPISVLSLFVDQEP